MNGLGMGITLVGSDLLSREIIFYCNETRRNNTGTVLGVTVGDFMIVSSRQHGTILVHISDLVGFKKL